MDRESNNLSNEESVDVLRRYRDLTDAFVARRRPSTAIFYANKLLTLHEQLTRPVGERLRDILRFANALYLDRQFDRALWILESNDALEPAQNLLHANTYHATTNLALYLEATLLAAQCLASVERWDDVVDIVAGVIGHHDDPDEQSLKSADIQSWTNIPWTYPWQSPHSTSHVHPAMKQFCSWIPWQRLVRIFQCTADNYVSEANVSSTKYIVHPLSLLCLVRAEAHLRAHASTTRPHAPNDLIQVRDPHQEPDRIGLNGDSGAAKAWGIAALLLDTRCIEAIDLLTNFHLLSQSEEQMLFGALESCLCLDQKYNTIRKEGLVHANDLASTTSQEGRTVQFKEVEGTSLVPPPTVQRFNRPSWSTANNQIPQELHAHTPSMASMPHETHTPNMTSMPHETHTPNMTSMPTDTHTTGITHKPSVPSRASSHTISRSNQYESHGPQLRRSHDPQIEQQTTLFPFDSDVSVDTSLGMKSVSVSCFCASKSIANLLRLYYQGCLNKFDLDWNIPAFFAEFSHISTGIYSSDIQSHWISLSSNVDVMALQAACAFNQYDPAAAATLTGTVLATDPYHASVMPIHFAALAAIASPGHSHQHSFMTQVSAHLSKPISMLSSGTVQSYWQRSNLSSNDITLSAGNSPSMHHTVNLALARFSANASNAGSTNAPRIRAELFRAAHEAVRSQPRSGNAWYGVGCYYWTAGQPSTAARHFRRATRLDPLCVPAWIGLGHARAAIEESDAALAAYRQAARLFPAHHAALLYMGMELSRTHHAFMAETMLHQSHRLCSSDPLVYHEQGVLAYKANEFIQACNLFKLSLNLTDHLPIPERRNWAPAYTNAGHAHRKYAVQMLSTLRQNTNMETNVLDRIKYIQNMYQKAIEQLQMAATYYEQALSLSAQAADVYADVLSFLALTLYQLGKAEQSLEYCVAAQSLIPDHAVSNALMPLALNASFQSDCSTQNLMGCTSKRLTNQSLFSSVHASNNSVAAQADNTFQSSFNSHRQTDDMSTVISTSTNRLTHMRPPQPGTQTTNNTPSNPSSQGAARKINMSFASSTLSVDDRNVHFAFETPESSRNSLRPDISAVSMASSVGTNRNRPIAQTHGGHNTSLLFVGEDQYETSSDDDMEVTRA